MRPKAGISPLSELLRGCLIAAGLLLVPLSLPIYVATSLIYTESKGPFKNWMQVVDWEGDGDLDVMVSHARWEDVDLSWAGVGLWINDGDGTFALRNAGDGEDWPFLGHAGAAADLDQDGDLDVLAQEFDIDVLVARGASRQVRRVSTSITVASTHQPPTPTATGTWAGALPWAT